MRELQGEAASAAVMTLADKRLFYAAVVRGQVAGASLSDRLRASELDSKLAGHLNGKGDKEAPSIVPRMIIRYGSDPLPEPVAGEEPPPMICNLPEIFRYGRGERRQDHSPGAGNETATDDD